MQPHGHSPTSGCSSQSGVAGRLGRRAIMAPMRAADASTSSPAAIAPHEAEHGDDATTHEPMSTRADARAET